MFGRTTIGPEHNLALAMGTKLALDYVVQQKPGFSFDYRHDFFNKTHEFVCHSKSPKDGLTRDTYLTSKRDLLGSKLIIEDTHPPEPTSDADGVMLKRTVETMKGLSVPSDTNDVVCAAFAQRRAQKILYLFLGDREELARVAEQIGEKVSTCKLNRFCSVA